MSEHELGRTAEPGRKGFVLPSPFAMGQHGLRLQALARDALLVAGVYLLWLGAAYAIDLIVTGARTPHDLLEPWVRFDGIYFRALAQYGYAEASRLVRYQQGFAFLTAFFPLFPLLISLAAPLFAYDYTAASVVVPQALTCLALIALFKLVELDFSRRVAWLTLLCLVVFPTSFFLLAPYSETLFLLLVVITFYFYRRRRFLPAGAAGLLASATRIMGPLVCGALLLALARRWWQQTLTRQRGPATHSLRALLHEFPDLPFVLLMPLGMLVYLAYLGLNFGDPLLFLRGHASSEWRVSVSLLGPLKSLGLPFYNLLARDWTSAAFRMNIFNSAFFYAAIAVAIYAWRKIPFSYSLYALLVIFVPTFDGTLISMPRYLLISFPLFIGMALFLEAHPRARVLLVPLGLCSIAGTFLFFRTVFLG